MSPCMLILEDIDTIVTPGSRSYFFNEVDGLENNDGIFMVASTNHLDQLDPGLSSRPSRFDRKYLFPLPNEAERILYCAYWRRKLASKPSIIFPKKLCIAIAGITQEFSFAYLKEAFVATLLTIARRRTEDRVRETDGEGDGDGDLDDYELWVEMKKTVKVLREDMGARGKRTAFGHVIEANSTKPMGMPSPGQGGEQVPGFGNASVHPDWMIQGKGLSVDSQTGDARGSPWSALPLIADGGEILSQPLSGLSIAPERG